jgi:hypothetical protein
MDASIHIALTTEPSRSRQPEANVARLGTGKGKHRARSSASRKPLEEMKPPVKPHRWRAARDEVPRRRSKR